MGNLVFGPITETTQLSGAIVSVFSNINYKNLLKLTKNIYVSTIGKGRQGEQNNIEGNAVTAFTISNYRLKEKCSLVETEIL